MRKPLGVHGAGEACLAHAALALVVGGEVGMRVELASEPRVVHADECEQQRVRDCRGRLVWQGSVQRLMLASRCRRRVINLRARTEPSEIREMLHERL